MKKLFLMSIAISMTLLASACNGASVLSKIGEKIDSVEPTVGNREENKQRRKDLKKIDKNICFVINRLVEVRNELDVAKNVLARAERRLEREEAKDSDKKNALKQAVYDASIRFEEAESKRIKHQYDFDDAKGRLKQAKADIKDSEEIIETEEAKKKKEKR